MKRTMDSLWRLKTSMGAACGQSSAHGSRGAAAEPPPRGGGA